MHILSAERAEALVRPHIDNLHGTFTSSFDAWHEITKHRPGDLGPRARGVVIYELVCAEAERRFRGVSGVTCFRGRGKVLVVSLFDNTGGDGVCLRFKKLNHSLKATFTNSLQSRSFEQQLTFPGWPNDTRAVCGYTVDAAGLRLESLTVTCSLNGEMIWAFPIEVSSVGTQMPSVGALSTKTSLAKPRRARRGTGSSGG